MFYLKGIHSVEIGQKCALSVVPYKINIENNILSILYDIIRRNKDVITEKCWVWCWM